MQICGGVEVQPHTFLPILVDRGAWSASHSSRFSHEKGASLTHCIGDIVGARSVLEAVQKRKISYQYN
jgi:hypothetical protein